MNLEQELKTALQRREPSPGFADRVLARLEQPQDEAGGRATVGLYRPRQPRRLLVAIAASIILVVLGGRQIERARARAEGEHAKQQVIAALEIASSKVNVARRSVQEVSRESRR